MNSGLTTFLTNSSGDGAMGGVKHVVWRAEVEQLERTRTLVSFMLATTSFFRDKNTVGSGETQHWT